MKRREMEQLFEEQRQRYEALVNEENEELGARLKALQAWQGGEQCADHIEGMDEVLDGARTAWRWRFAVRSPVVRVALGAYDTSTKTRELVVIKEHGAYFFELTSEDEEALAAPVDRHRMGQVNALVKGRELVSVVGPWCRLALNGEHGFSAEFGLSSSGSHSIYVNLKRVMGRELTQWLLSFASPAEAEVITETLLCKCREGVSEWADDVVLYGATAYTVANMVRRLRGA